MAVRARAKRYAEAVAQMARENDSWDQWDQDLSGLARLVEDSSFKAVLESPKVPLARKEELITQALPNANPLVRNLAQLLILRRRIDAVPDILNEFRRMHDVHRGIEHATVTTAVPLEQREREALLQQLTVMTGKRVEVETEVDPGILGGMVVRIGDKLIDGSTRGRLEALRRRLAG